MDLDPDLVTQLHELVDGGGPVDVGGDEERLLPVLAQADGQFGGGRRLSRALKADHHDDGGPGIEAEVMPLAAERRHELLVHDLHDLLPRIEPGEQVAPDGSVADPRDEVLDDLEVDVGLEQREPDLAQGDVEVALGDLCLATQTICDALQAR